MAAETHPPGQHHKNFLIGTTGLAALLITLGVAVAAVGSKTTYESQAWGRCRSAGQICGGSRRRCCSGLECNTSLYRPGDSNWGRCERSGDLPQPNGAACTEHGDCASDYCHTLPNGQKICMSRRPVHPTPTPRPQGGSCTIDDDCQPGLICRRNLCTEALPGHPRASATPAPGKCRFDYECGTDHRCINGTCIEVILPATRGDGESCSADYQCQSFLRCTNNVCTNPLDAKKPNNAVCSADSQCESGNCEISAGMATGRCRPAPTPT